MPFASYPGHCEVIGLGDGLRLWYGVDFDEANRLLGASANGRGNPHELAQRGLALKQVLSLIVAQRRPSYFLRSGRDDLEALTDSYLRLLAGSGVINPGLRDAALNARLRSEEHTSELQSLMRISYAVFCLKKKNSNN